MTMYVPQRFAAPNSAAALTVIENYGFATLVAPAGDECHITHLPLLLDREKNQCMARSLWPVA
ncbi:MAG: FMN-binding negative transcriptional regulator [Proteobacteria bacterium]|nr:FMN-binding negative transcriptional regulator [Pseudomonadota bacterium]